MAMDLRVYAGISCPEKMSPRRITHFHGLVMASKRRELAMQTNAMMMAVSAGFNGDKENHFSSFINGLYAKTVIKSMTEGDNYASSQNIENDEEAQKSILEYAAKVREKRS